MAVIQFLGAEGCQPTEIHMKMSVVCVSKPVVVDWLHMFHMCIQQVMAIPRLE
jgi:hypothetical protein